jgi:hypothetical protein
MGSHNRWGGCSTLLSEGGPSRRRSAPVWTVSRPTSETGLNNQHRDRPGAGLRRRGYSGGSAWSTLCAWGAGKWRGRISTPPVVGPQGSPARRQPEGHRRPSDEGLGARTSGRGAPQAPRPGRAVLRNPCPPPGPGRCCPHSHPSPEEQERLPVPRVLVRQVQVTGNTLFSKEALAAVTAAYVNHHVTSEELEELRLA